MMRGVRNTFAILLQAAWAWTTIVGGFASAQDDAWPFGDEWFAVPSVLENWTEWQDSEQTAWFNQPGLLLGSDLAFDAQPLPMHPPEWLTTDGDVSQSAVPTGGEVVLCAGEYLVINPGSRAPVPAQRSAPRAAASYSPYPQAPQRASSFAPASYPTTAPRTYGRPPVPQLAQAPNVAPPAVPSLPGAVATPGNSAGNASSNASSNASGQTTYGKEPTPTPPAERQQFLRTQSPLLKRGKYQFDIGLAYTLFEYNFPAIDSSSALVRADLRRHTLICPFAIRYGWSDKTQLFANVPVGWRGTEVASSPLTTPAPFNDMGAYGGVGDITLGATHLLRKGYKTLPDVVFTLSGGLPTGEKSLLSNATTGGLGTGYGSLGGQLIMIHTYDPFVFYWGGGCNFYFEGNIDGTPVKLGDQYLFQVGTGFAINDRVTISSGLIGGYVGKTTVNNNIIQNTQQEPFRFRSAVTLQRCKKIIEPFVEIGLTTTSPTVRTGATWTF